MSEYFKMGVDGEGFAFFIPDSYSITKMTLGSGIRRSINGKAHQDVVAIKHKIDMSFSLLNKSEFQNFASLYLRNVEDGMDLRFIDDEENEYVVMWSGDFNINERVQDEEIYWNGTITLEEI